MRTTMLIAALAVFAAFSVVFMVPIGGAGAQETTDEPDVLTRYDDELTKQLEAEYDALKQEEDAFLSENPSAGFYEDDEKANDLADARMRAIENAPVPEGTKERAEELRRQAESLYALQSWGDSAGIDVNSNVYSDGAELLAQDYEDEAEELEAEAAEEEAAREEATEPPGETVGTAAGGGGNEAEAGSDDPPAQKLEGSGASDEGGGSPVPGNDGGGMNLGAFVLLVFALFGVVAYGLSAAVKRPGSMVKRLAGAWRARFGSMQAAVPVPAGRKKPPDDEDTNSSASVAEAPKPDDPGPDETQDAARVEPRRPAEGREESTEKPSSDMGQGSSDGPGAESLAAWYAQEPPRDEPEEIDAETFQKWFGESPGEDEQPRRRRGGEASAEPEGSPETEAKDVNQAVAEEVTRMRRSGELSEDDEVEVRVEGGKIVVRKKE